MAFGTNKPKFSGGSYKKRNTWGIKPGNNPIRVLPQMHSLAEDEDGWHVYVKMHWGYQGVDSKDPSKTRGKPFNCIEDKDRRNGLVLQECPECTKVAQVEAEKVELEAKLNAEAKEKGLSTESKGKNKEGEPLPSEFEEYVEAGLTPIKLWLKAHNLDKKVYLAVKKGDEYGQFKVTYTMFKAMRAKMKEIDDAESINALALDQGLIFNVIRKGDGFVERDTFEIVMEDVVVNGKKYKQYKLASISEEEANKALEEIDDLAKAGGLRITFDQIQALVNSSGDPEEVDAILALGKAELSTTKVGDDGALKKTSNLGVNLTPKAPAPVAVVAKIETVANDNDAKNMEAALQARLNGIKAKAAADAKAKADAEAAKAAETSTGAEDLLSLSDEEFLARMNVAAK